MTVRIVTDSASDLSHDEAERLGVGIVPLTIRFGTEELTDREELSVDDFYERMASSEVLPQTAAPSPGAFEDAFRSASDNGDPVVCVNLSSKLSATMQSAVQAAEALADEIDVRVVDSNSITSGLGTQVIRAAEAGAAGAGADEIVDLLGNLSDRTRVVGALDTLDNLRKGGRIGGAQALLGSMLSIKPVVDISTGEVEEAAKPRTRRKALEWLRNKLFSEGEVESLTVAHGAAPDLDTFLDLIEDRYPRDKIRVCTIGAVIGAHGGPRMMGITYLTPEH